MLDDIDLVNIDNKNKIVKWNDFLIKYPEVIEYIDIEESETLMIAMYVKDLIKNEQTMNRIIKNPNENGNAVNRYDDNI